jgi:hypothetical protein
LSEAALAAAPPQRVTALALYAIVTTLTWGVWGALIELPEKAGFPPTLGYTVWALTMIPCAAVVLGVSGWRVALDRRALLLGSAADSWAPAARSSCSRRCARGPRTSCSPWSRSIPP